MNILLLCRKEQLQWGQWAYACAFERRGVRWMCVEGDVSQSVDVSDLVSKCPARPSLILHPELDPSIFPRGLAVADIPTACFQIDTYAYTRRRARWSMLFDYPIVFHPRFAEEFRRAGHPSVLTLYHAAAIDLFEKPEEERVWEVGWVGRSFAAIHDSRRRVLTSLAAEFRVNDWNRFYSFEEMAGIYRHAKVVVNLPRDDFPADANMRAFEAMAAGALLITRMPSELTAIGFEEGAHFVGYRKETEIRGLVCRYLEDGVARQRIAEAGREKVFREHTYDCRARQLIRMVEENQGRLTAPARDWPEERVRLTYLDYYAAHGQLHCAYSELRQIAKRSLRNSLAGGSLIARAWARRVRGQVVTALQRES